MGSRHEDEACAKSLKDSALSDTSVEARILVHAKSRSQQNMVKELNQFVNRSMTIKRGARSKSGTSTSWGRHGGPGVVVAFAVDVAVVVTG